MRILCLFLRYGTQDYRGSLDRLILWYRATLPSVEVEFAVIDNAIAETDGTQAPNIFPGDNRAGEFSGFERFLTEHWDRVEQTDLVHFVTSAYEQNYNRYLEHVEMPALQYAASSLTCLAHIDSYDRAITLQGSRSRHWVRTCFFFLPPEAIRRIARWDNAPAEHTVFDNENWCRSTTLISENYIDYISTWLSGQPQQGVTYHSPKTTLVEFRRKAMAILREHSLAIEFRRLGFWLLDFAFSHCAYEQGESLVFARGTPWELQVAARTVWLERNTPEQPKRPIPTIHTAAQLPFGSEAAHGLFRRFGWSEPEPGFCWTTARVATLHCRLGVAACKLRLIAYAAAFARIGAHQTIHISINGVRTASWLVSETPAQYDAEFETNVTRAYSDLIIRFDLPDAASPASLSLGSDTRLLGIRIFWMRIDTLDSSTTASQPSTHGISA